MYYVVWISIQEDERQGPRRLQAPADQIIITLECADCIALGHLDQRNIVSRDYVTLSDTAIQGNDLHGHRAFMMCR